MRVLLIEDELEFAGPLRGALEREGFIVDHADQLAVAREAARLGSYDLILLDRTLPDGDGLSLIPTLRAGSPGLPIILLSARGGVLDRRCGLSDRVQCRRVRPQRRARIGGPCRDRAVMRKRGALLVDAACTLVSAPWDRRKARLSIY